MCIICEGEIGFLAQGATTRRFRERLEAEALLKRAFATVLCWVVSFAIAPKVCSGQSSMAKTATQSRLPSASFRPSGASEKEFARPGMGIALPRPGMAGFHK